MHTLQLNHIKPLTHDVFRLRFPKPQGFAFTPGQATDFALAKDGWVDEKRPFTFTSLIDDDELEFVIKSYPSHHGVTEQIAKMAPGDEVQISDPWGAIEDRGPGVIIAGGAGITPFLAILRNRLKQEGSLSGFQLLFSNKREQDIILREELAGMEGLVTHFLLSEEEVEGLPHGHVDGTFLDKVVANFTGVFYLCGPPPMEDAVSKALKERGVSDDRLVREE